VLTKKPGFGRAFLSLNSKVLRNVVVLYRKYAI
jgi:hypothetical protein